MAELKPERSIVSARGTGKFQRFRQFSLSCVKAGALSVGDIGFRAAFAVREAVSDARGDKFFSHAAEARGIGIRGGSGDQFNQQRASRFAQNGMAQQSVPSVPGCQAGTEHRFPQRGKGPHHARRSQQAGGNLHHLAGAAPPQPQAGQAVCAGGKGKFHLVAETPFR